MTWLLAIALWGAIGTAVWVTIQPNWEGQVAPQFVVWGWPVILVLWCLT